MGYLTYRLTLSVLNMPIIFLPERYIRPLRPNVTSSMQPEVHNVSQCRQRRTKPWPEGICTKNFVKISPG